MRSTRSLALALLALAVACDASRRPAPDRRVLATFTGEVDVATGTVRILSQAPVTAGVSRARLEIPVVQDGRAGSGPPDTVELVTEGVVPVEGGCGAVNGFEGAVRLRSFFAGAVLANVHVELVTLAPSGHEACNSAPATGDLSAELGLFAYGSVGRDGGGSSSVLRPWRFRVPDETAFTFTGHVVGDLVTSDASPPVTAAAPLAGTYPAGWSATLGCVDAETGCAATHYTTDGTTPTTASPAYTGPIPISSSFTLRWFSLDRWGNAEAVQSASYVLDATAPAVVAVSPTAGMVGVATSSTVAVTFSEPVDPATVDDATLFVSGPAGAVAGTIAPNGTNTVFTFTPASALDVEAQYAVTATSGVRDLVGNALAPAHASTFYTPTARRSVQPATAARLAYHDVVYDASGNALAAWSALTQAGSAVVYAYRPSGGAWGAGRVLDTVRDTNGNATPVRITTDGAQFLVAWCTKDKVRAVRVQSGTPTGAAADLATGGASLVQSDFTASSSAANRFLVVRSYLSNVTGWYWNGTTWSAGASIGGGDTPLLAGNALYYLGDDNLSVKGSTFGTAWSAPVSVVTTTIAQGSPTTLSVTRGAQTVLAYGTTAGHVWTAIGSGTSFGSPYDVTTSAGGEATSPAAVATGAWGSEYAVAFVTASGKVYGTFRNNGFWPASPAQLFSSGGVAVALAGYSYGFAAAVTVRDAGSSASSLWAVPSTTGANGRTWLAAVAAEGSSSSAGAPGVVAAGAEAMLHWVQADADADQVQLRSFSGSTAPPTLGTVQAASAPAAVRGSVANVRLAVNAAGDVMAVWAQDDLGAQSVFAAVHNATGWSATTRVVEGASSPAVASNGAGFLVTATAGSRTTVGSRDLVAVPYVEGAFGTVEVVASGNVGSSRVASDGAGYAAIWQRGTAVEAAIREGSSWLTTLTLGSGVPGDVAGRGGEYLFAWPDQAGEHLAQRRAVRAGGTGSWGWEGASYAAVWPYDVDIAATPDGFFLAYRNMGGLLDGWKVVAGVKGTPVALGSGSNPCQGPRIAVSGNRYLVALNCSNALVTVETDGNTRLGPVTHVTGLAGSWPVVLGYDVAGGPGGTFRLVFSWVPAQFMASNLYATQSTGGTWGSRVTLDDRAEPTQSAVALAWDGGTYLALWSQQTATNAVVDDLVGWWAF